VRGNPGGRVEGGKDKVNWAKVMSKKGKYGPNAFGPGRRKKEAVGIPSQSTHLEESSLGEEVSRAIRGLGTPAGETPASKSYIPPPRPSTKETELAGAPGNLDFQGGKATPHLVCRRAGRRKGSR